jgi:hypothetical protein
MAIDLGKEFKRMAEEFEISDKEALKSVRTMIRSAWGDSIFKQEFLNRRMIIVENTNPRSMKRFPKVKRYKCEICGEYFGSNDVELDHLESENTLKEYSDIEDIFKAIVLTSPYKLQIVCKDKRKKGITTYFGCHGIKTYSERYGCSFEEARIQKEYILIIKDKLLVVDKLKEFGVESIPKTIKARNELLKKLMLESVNE